MPLSLIFEFSIQISGIILKIRYTVYVALNNSIQSSTSFLMDKQEAAERLRISIRFLDVLISGRKIGCYRLGTRVLLSIEQIEDYQASSEVRPAGHDRPDQVEVAS